METSMPLKSTTTSWGILEEKAGSRLLAHIGDSPFSWVGYADMYLSENDMSPCEDDMLLLEVAG